MAWMTPDFLWEHERTDALVGDHLSADWPNTFTLRAPDQRPTVAAPPRDRTSLGGAPTPPASSTLVPSSNVRGASATTRPS